VGFYTPKEAVNSRGETPAPHIGPGTHGYGLCVWFMRIGAVYFRSHSTTEHTSDLSQCFLKQEILHGVRSLPTPSFSMPLERGDFRE
jgi:hypothetical protein